MPARTCGHRIEGLVARWPLSCQRKRPSCLSPLVPPPPLLLSLLLRGQAGTESRSALPVFVGSVSTCTFVPVKQVNQSTCHMALMHHARHSHNLTQRLRCQYLHVCTSTASKPSTLPRSSGVSICTFVPVKQEN